MQVRHPTQTRSLSRGFTIVELLIVIVIIGILAGLVIVTFTGVQDRAKRVRVDAELAQIKKAMLAYKSNHGELPPLGDWSTINSADNTVSLSSWQTVLQALVDDGIISQNAVGKMLYDPWGNPYAYDDNDCNAVFDGNIYPTYLRSIGPDHKAYYDSNGNTDDEQIVVTDSC